MENGLVLILFCLAPLLLNHSLGPTDQSINVKEVEKLIEDKENTIGELKSQLEWHKDQLRKLPTSCSPFGNYFGVQTIKVPNWNVTQVFCNTFGWIVIQRRLGESLDFSGNWTEYRNGFGYLTDEFFLGLEVIHRITATEPQELYIHLTDLENQTAYAWYDDFAIGGEETGYMLTTLGEYVGTAGDSMRDNVRHKFTTQDRDDDAWQGYNCASGMNGGWWFTNCGLSNLNGPYSEEKGVYWYTWQKWKTIKSVEMMIRRKYATF